MKLLACIVLLALTVGIYALGYSDGRLSMEEEAMFQKFDDLVERVGERLAGTR